MTLPVIRVPGDKSISHRALLLAALADGESRIGNLQHGEDVRATARALRALGCALDETTATPGDDGVVRVSGMGLRGCRPAADAIDCGNSGTTARLLLGVLAAQSITAVLTGDASLRSRPMRRVTEPLAAMGAQFEELGEPDRLPLRVRGGALHAITHASPHASAQVKSALLLAGLAAGVPVRIREPHLSRDHTERMLRARGVPVTVQRVGAAHEAAIEPVLRLAALDVTVPGDFSAAAFFIALGALGGGPGVRVLETGVNPTRTGMLPVLARMGAHVAIENERDASGEPVADLVARPTKLQATDIAAAEVPALIDEIPILAVLAARADGTTRIRGAAELRVKETDRIRALVHNLRALGVDVDEAEDGMTITGTQRPLRGKVRTFGDHRIAMAFAVLGATRNAEIEIDDPGIVAISFPAFWEQLRITREWAA